MCQIGLDSGARRVGVDKPLEASLALLVLRQCLGRSFSFHE